MRGKYSPTVTSAYLKDQDWHRKFREGGSNASPGLCDPVYDPEGFDSYGYDRNDVDRAGNEECGYYPDDDESGAHFGNSKYDDALTAWGFDGKKPVRTK